MAAAAAWRLAALVGITVVGAVATGCGREPDDPTGGSPTPAPIATTPVVDPVGAPTGGDYPDAVQEYAETAVAAWAAPDLIRLSELTTSEVYQQIVEIPGPPDQAWRFIRCDASSSDDPSSDCSFHNADGDHLALAVEHELLGQPEAVVAATFDVPTYPAQATDYVEAFVAAWQAGNQARMALLAVTDAAEAIQQLPIPAEVNYEAADPDDGTVTVTMVLTGADSGDDTEVEIRLGSARLGGEKAIIAAAVPES